MLKDLLIRLHGNSKEDDGGFDCKLNGHSQKFFDSIIVTRNIETLGENRTYRLNKAIKRNTEGI